MNLVTKLENFINRFVSFADPMYSLPIALWNIGTHVYPHFDAYPYMVITSATKRSGKTRLMECCSFLSANSRNAAGMTAPNIFRLIQEYHPTLMIDEAETFSSEAATDKRAALNVGYRRGTSIYRGTGLDEFDTYCPKIFVLIGDVWDTLKDRSIVIRMQRAEAKERFLWEPVKAEGEALRAEISEALKQIPQNSLIECYHKTVKSGLPSLTDRDEEIWSALFTICHLLASHRIKELSANAVDIATEKTAESRKHVQLLKNDNAEDRALEAEYREKLLFDLYGLFLDGRTKVSTAQAIESLKAIPTAPWRKFRGSGLDHHDLANLLRTFLGSPVRIALGSGRGNQKIVRGYRKSDVEKAVQKLK